MISAMNEPGLELLKRSYILALSPEEQEEAFAELGEQLFTRLIARAVTILPQEHATILVEMLESDAEGDMIVTFLVESIPTLPEIVSECAMSLARDRAELLPAV
jgi:hypothetical protein